MNQEMVLGSGLVSLCAVIMNGGQGQATWLLFQPLVSSRMNAATFHSLAPGSMPSSTILLWALQKTKPSTPTLPCAVQK